MNNSDDAMLYVKGSNIGTSTADVLGAYIGVSDGTLDDAYSGYAAFTNASDAGEKCDSAGAQACYTGGTKVGLLTTAQATLSTANVSTNNAFGIITTATAVDGLAFSLWGTGVMHNEGEIQGTADIVAYHSSDIRMKDNIVDISNPIDKIKQIRGVYFDWNKKGPGYTKGWSLQPDGVKHDVGVIAQEIQKVLPEAVIERTKASGEGMEGMLAVDYEKIIPLLIEGIKEQQTVIDDLQNRIKKIEEK